MSAITMVSEHACYGGVQRFYRHETRETRRPAAGSGQRLDLRMQPGYDHGYYFIQTFMADHLRHQVDQLRD